MSVSRAPTHPHACGRAGRCAPPTLYSATRRTKTSSEHFVATPTPTSSPTMTPEKVKDDLLPAWQIGLILLAAAIVVGLVGVAMSRVSCNDTSETYGKPETQI